jgi:ATP/maltotriose-dependent transcriptional regulator MalT
MHEILSGNDRRQSLVLYGLGGIGKTQLAVAYARLHKAEYSAILWLNIKDEDSLKQSFARAARRILRENPLPSSLDAVAEDNNLDKVVDAVKRWLDHSKNTRWLVVYDNYDNPKLPGVTDHAAVDIRRFLPEADHGSIIITTRISQVKFGHSIHVTKLADVRDSLQILFDTSRRNDTMDST